VPEVGHADEHRASVSLSDRLAWRRQALAEAALRRPITTSVVAAAAKLESI
jgi:hypothetical protein